MEIILLFPFYALYIKLYHKKPSCQGKLVLAKTKNETSSLFNGRQSLFFKRRYTDLQNAMAFWVLLYNISVLYKLEEMQMMAEAEEIEC